LHKFFGGDTHCEDLPDELTDYMLSKEFGWTPSQINEQDDMVIRKYITLMNIEGEEQERSQKK
jgi:hypothetical protein